MGNAPAEKEKPDPAPEAVAGADGGEPSPGGGNELFGLRGVGDINLLVVDDDQAVCKVIRLALTHGDLHIDVVSDPTQVEAQLRAKRYEVIILDYVLPGLES